MDDRPRDTHHNLWLGGVPVWMTDQHTHIITFAPMLVGSNKIISIHSDLESTTLTTQEALLFKQT